MPLLNPSPLGFNGNDYDDDCGQGDYGGDFGGDFGADESVFPPDMTLNPAPLDVAPAYELETVKIDFARVIILIDLFSFVIPSPFFSLSFSHSFHRHPNKLILKVSNLLSGKPSKKKKRKKKTNKPSRFSIFSHLYF